MLNLYRAALRIRRDQLGDGTITWVPLGDEVLAFARESGLMCVVNLGQEPVRLPDHQQICLASGPVDGGLLPSDTAVWLV
jgi:alpha-glucosidase